MFYLAGKYQLLKNISSLLQSQDSIQSTTIHHLRERYVQFINRYQPQIPRSSMPRPEILAPNNSEKLSALSLIFTSQDSILTDFKNSAIKYSYNETEYNYYRQNIECAIQRLKRYDSDFYNFFKLTITDLFFGKSKGFGGGTVSSAIGVVWCGANEKWCEDDFLEMIVHECTHNFLFIDELVFSHYLDIKKMSDRKNFAISAVLGKKRPLDKVIHALIVAFEIYMFRKNTHTSYRFHKVKIHPNSELLLNNCKKSIDSIKESKNSENILTERIWNLIELIECKIDAEICQNEKVLSM